MLSLGLIYFQDHKTLYKWESYSWFADFTDVTPVSDHTYKTLLMLLWEVRKKFIQR